MTFLLDNYDSFTYNLAQYLGELGERVVVRRNDQVTLAEIERLKPARIVISPGPGTPDTAGITLELIARFSGRTPILGVCLGHQAIGQAFGGRVVSAPTLMHGKTSPVLHDGRGVFRGLPQRFTAIRYHSLVVSPKSFPKKELVVSARTPEGVIMGLRHRRHRIEGVQFHPESILTGEGRRLLANFLALR
ncbi:MAG TPA: aminodeoxychorismate/anthranilate synthase component II [Candidatus Xenobia bacterium]|nr:aminodeoxychorismate/anthranilate synthase component II [Candidatus Xenobia bacterium]